MYSDFNFLRCMYVTAILRSLKRTHMTLLVKILLIYLANKEA